MNVRMVCQGLSPSMQNTNSTHLRTHELRVRCTLQQGFPGSFEKKAVAFALIDIKKCMQTVWYGKNHMKMFYHRKVGSEFIHPLSRFYKLALWTIRERQSYSAEALPVSARVIRLSGVTTGIAALHMPP